MEAYSWQRDRSGLTSSLSCLIRRSLCSGSLHLFGFKSTSFSSVCFFEAVSRIAAEVERSNPSVSCGRAQTKTSHFDLSFFLINIHHRKSLTASVCAAELWLRLKWCLIPAQRHWYLFTAFRNGWDSFHLKQAGFGYQRRKVNKLLVNNHPAANSSSVQGPRLRSHKNKFHIKCNSVMYTGRLLSVPHDGNYLEHNYFHFWRNLSIFFLAHSCIFIYLFS